MKLTDKTTKNGESILGEYKLYYSIDYGGEQVASVSAQIKKVEGEWVRTIGNFTYSIETGRFNFALMDGVSTEDRVSMFNDFEKTLKEVVC